MKQLGTAWVRLSSDMRGSLAWRAGWCGSLSRRTAAARTLTTRRPPPYMSIVELSKRELSASELYRHGPNDARPPAGHARPPRPQDALLGPCARVRDRPMDGAAHRRRAQTRPGLAVPGALPTRGTRLDRQRVAALRHQPPHEG